MNQMPLHKCAQPKCEKQISRAMYACPRHWRELPQKIRRNIWGAHSARDLTGWLVGDKKAKAFWNAQYEATEKDF